LEPDLPVKIGNFELVLKHEAHSSNAVTQKAVKDRSHIEFVGLEDEAVAEVQLVLMTLEDRANQRMFPLEKAVMTVGASGSDIVLANTNCVREQIRLLIYRGRVIVEPRAGTTEIEGHPVRAPYPLREGERMRIGNTSLVLRRQTSTAHHEESSFGDMIGESQRMRRTFGLLRRIAPTPYPVLLLGESGTGKELAARAIHENSLRASGPYIPVNCGSFTESLVEAELFGYEKGAFTGANTRKDGAFIAAHKGTLFLDEIGEMPLSTQVKLLRTLETGEVRRVGSTQPEFPDVRIVAATHRDLAKHVQEGTFRQDLYFRLSILGARLPALRERIEDLPQLCTRLCEQLGDAAVTDDAMELLKSHTWPGNVRELRNVLTRSFVLHGSRLSASAIQFNAITEQTPTISAVDMKTTERLLVQSALERHSGNRAAAARELGIPRTTLLYKLRRLGIDKTTDLPN